MKNCALTIIIISIFAMSIPAAAQTQDPEPPVGSMIRSGWVSPVSNDLKRVPDPKNNNVSFHLMPDRREAGTGPIFPLAATTRRK